MLKIIFFLLFSIITGEALAAQASLTWQDNSTGEDGFIIERRLNTEPLTAYKEIGRTTIGVANFIDTTIIAGTVYCYRVAAFNQVGKSGYSNEACIFGNPSGLTVVYTP